MTHYNALRESISSKAGKLMPGGTLHFAKELIEEAYSGLSPSAAIEAFIADLGPGLVTIPLRYSDMAVSFLRMKS